MEKWKQDRVRLMKQIAQEVASSTRDSLVLKGGAALLLAHKSARYTKDMDFDGKRPVDMEKYIRLAAQKCDLKIEDIILKKDTETTRRYMVHYGADNEEGAYPLKLECSFRQAAAIDEKDIRLIDGMRVYSPEKLADQKVKTLIERDSANDIYDVKYLLDKHPEAFSPKTLQSLKDGIEAKGLNSLLKICEDHALKEGNLSGTDPVEMVVGLEQRTNYLYEQSRENAWTLPKGMEEIKSAPNSKELPDIVLPKTLFLSYAKEALLENDNKWCPQKTNEVIIEKMLSNNVPSLRIKAALDHSPEKVPNALKLIKTIENTPQIKALQSTRGLER